MPGMVEGYAGFGNDVLVDEFTSSAIAAKSLDQLAHSWAHSFSNIAIASSVGVMIPVPLKEHTPTITAVLKAPLLMLWGSTLLYAVFALGLAAAAVRNVLVRPEVRDVQARMSIMGITSQALEPDKYAASARSTDDLFQTTNRKNDYSNRVTVYRTAPGGWSWETLHTQQRRPF
jgi:hypothetical protein